MILTSRKLRKNDKVGLTIKNENGTHKALVQAGKFKALFHQVDNGDHFNMIESNQEATDDVIQFFVELIQESMKHFIKSPVNIQSYEHILN